MSYGTPVGVASLAQMWTRGGSWVDPVAEIIANPMHVPPILHHDAVLGSNPTLTQVTTWLTELSAMMDLALSNAGFLTPVLVVAAIAAITPYIQSLTADLCHAANSSGRFFTERVIERGMSPMIIVQQNINGWVQDNTQGLKNLGVPYVGADSPIHAFSVQPGKQL